MIAHLALLAMLQQTSPPTTPDKSYLFFVASEGSDEVALMRFDATGLRVEHRTLFKIVPGQLESPPDVFTERFAGLDTTTVAVGRSYSLSSAHGFSVDALMSGPRHLTIGRDGRSYYVTTARGFAGGELLAVRIAADSAPTSQPPDTILGRESLAGVPGAAQITLDGGYAWVVTSTPASESRASWLAVVYLPSMVEAGRIPICSGAPSSRFSADGRVHYSLCDGDDGLIEIDARAIRVSRHLALSGVASRRCAPSGLAVLTDGSRIFVACQQSNEILEIDARSWVVTRRVAIARSPGELAVTGDGKTLVVINATSQAISVVDLAAGGKTVALALSHHAPAAVAIGPDDRYAFVTFAGAGTEPGTVEVIDLSRRVVVASLDFGRRLAGIAFWKSTP